MTGFDPLALAASCRAGLYLTLDRSAADFDASGQGRVAAFGMQAIVSAWLVGEAERLHPRLDKAAEWLASSDAALGNEDGEGPFGIQRRRRALATALWLLGQDPHPASVGAARAGAAYFATNPKIAPEERADHLCDWLLAGDPDAVLAAAAACPPDPGDIVAATALKLAGARRDGNTDDPGLCAAVGAMLAAHVPQWLDSGAFIRVASWCRAIFADPGLAGDPEGALLLAWMFIPEAPVPPSLETRGWNDTAETTLVALPSPDRLPRVDTLATIAGLARDRDAVSRDAAAPALATWSAPPPGDREIDWHDDGGRCWLEIRGPGAGVLAGAVAAGLGGQIGDDSVMALAKYLKVPTGDGSLGATGALRWSVLRAAVAAYVPETTLAITALIMAGLADPDWRVRMTAVLAVGRLKLAALADAAMAAKVPPAGRDGLGQEDRRMLLALRQAAHDRAKGAPPWGVSDDPAIAAKRRAHQARLHSRLQNLPAIPEDRADALLLGLLGGPEALGQRVPGAWRAWLGRTSPT
jgi:hypothetical protein